MINQILSHQYFTDNIILIVGIMISGVFLYASIISIVEKEYRASKASSIFAVVLFILAKPKKH